MDSRLIVTSAFAAHLVGGLLLAVSYAAVDVTFTEQQGEFLVFVGVLGPLFSLLLIWAGNGVLGAPLFVASTGGTAWYTAYFFFVHDNPGTVWVAEGDASTAYLFSAVTLVTVSFAAALVGCWLWYRESEGFRAVVDALLRSTRT